MKYKFLWLHNGHWWSIGLEWQPRDLWIGLFWKHEPDTYAAGGQLETWHIWLGLVPMLPLHIQVVPALRRSGVA